MQKLLAIQQAQEGNSRVPREMTNKRVKTWVPVKKWSKMVKNVKNVKNVPPPLQGRAICIDTISIQYRYNIDTIRYNIIPKIPKNYQKLPKIPENSKKILKNTLMHHKDLE